MKINEFRFSEARLSLKVLLSCFLIAVAVGYIFGLIHIYTDVGFSYTGVVSHYRGGKELSVPPDFAFAKLIHVHHVHLFGHAMLFLLVGSIFIFTELPEVWKAVFVAAPFVGMAVDFTSFWLLTFVSPVFAALAMIFGAFMAFSFFMIIGRPLYEMWVLPVWGRVWKDGEIPWYLR